MLNITTNVSLVSKPAWTGMVVDLGADDARFRQKVNGVRSLFRGLIVFRWLEDMQKALSDENVRLNPNITVSQPERMLVLLTSVMVGQGLVGSIPRDIIASAKQAEDEMNMEDATP